MNVLITGATGFLGSHILRELVKGQPSEVTALVRNHAHCERIADLQDKITCVNAGQTDFAQLIESRQIDTIIHCATNYGRSAASRPDIVDANLVLPLRLLDAAARVPHGVSFINTDTMLDKNVSAYSMSKKQFRDWLQAYADTGVCINVALEHFFGPGDDPTKFTTSVVRALLRNDARIELTEGYQMRDFVYIDDVVSAFLCIARFARDSAGGFYEFEIGRGEPITIRNFVALCRNICQNSTTELAFGALPYRSNEVMHVEANTTKIRELGWVPRFDVEQGLRRMVEREGK